MVTTNNDTTGPAANQRTDKPLTVYKASAGSGKTFTLAVEYITLLVRNPLCFRNILAVTFTNKATEEMKMRILSQLYGISHRLPDSDVYLHRVCEAAQMGEQQVSQRAGQALHLLLHNYNYFRVETIDSFFQSVLRNLARELDLTANLRVSLNDHQVEEQAVDQLIDSLTHQDAMLGWLLSYIMEKISDDHSWNIIGQVKQFGKTIFRDYYKQHSRALKAKVAEPGFLDAYTRQLRQMRAAAMERMKRYGDDFFDTLDAEGIGVGDLAYKEKGVASYFRKLQQGTFDASIDSSRACDCRGDAAKWYSKTCPQRQHIHAVAESALMPLLAHAMDDRPRQWRVYKSADLTLQHLSQLRLLGSIEEKVRQLNNDANRFLLSDTQQLLHDLISDSDSPFIFEKIGTQLEHIMIDEFQDTSTVQWQNFKILLEECMSRRDSRNLIVGDVKQSIYRWRSGDWRLLNAIDRQFTDAGERVDIRPLTTNYRSAGNVIAFNNAFFTLADDWSCRQLADSDDEGARMLHHAYADVEQHGRPDAPREGHVSVRLISSDGDDYQQQTLDQLTGAIDRLLADGVPMTDIAILVRTNKHIPLVAEHFAVHRPEVPIVSDEAFRLDASTAVCLLVQALHLLTHPDDQLARATVAKLYRRTVLGDATAESELLIQTRPLDELLPEAFTAHTDALLHLPLYELVERLYDIFQLQRLREQSAYLCAFYDLLSDFTTDNGTDIDAFVREWDETIGSKTVLGDTLDGVRILSIHKSKGLEFPHVVVPFCDWRLEHADILWCRPAEPPFDALPIVPVSYGEKQLTGTVYEADYREEHLQNTVDNLNLLYVAFTRAVRSLHVIGQRGGRGNRSAMLEAVLPDVADRLPTATLSGLEDAGSDLLFEFGTHARAAAASAGEAAGTAPARPATAAAAKAATRNVFLRPVTPVRVELESFDLKTEFRQSNSSRRFIAGDEGDDAQPSYIKTGSVLHEIFSSIRTSADIDAALRQLQFDGVLYDDEVTAERLARLLHKRLEDRRVADWFSGRWQLFNECTIICNDGDKTVERRPDRVMTDGRETHVVDFKFGRPRPEYRAQVGEYMQLLQRMGLPGVQGWLWYVYSNQIEEVRL